MRKNAKFFIIMWVVIFVVFNAVELLIPFSIQRSTQSFWIALGMVNVSLIGFLLATLFAGRLANVRNDFYNLAIFKNAMVCMPLVFIVGIVLMIFPIIPGWVTGIICLLIFAYFLLRVVKTAAAASAVEGIDMEVKEKTSRIRELVLESRKLTASADTAELKALCADVESAFRYSDPMSSPAIRDIEAEMVNHFNNFRAAVRNKDLAAATSIARVLKNTIKHRNEKCKETK